MSEQEFASLIEQVAEQLDKGKLAAAKKLLAKAEADAPPGPEAELCLGELWFELEEFEPAKRLLARAAAPDVDAEVRADALHALGGIHDELGDAAARTTAWLEVAALDAAAPSPPWMLDDEAFHDEAEVALSELADIIQHKLREGEVPILIESAPSEALVRDGVDPRALGIFEGAPLAEAGMAPMPTVIRLFRANIAAASEDEADMREQVRITVWHETAHYFGLDDDELEELGLG